jgi:hypothetical protein
MEFLFFLIESVPATILGIVITILFEDWLKDLLVPLTMKLGSKKDESISGVWRCTFFYDNQEVGKTEIIEIKGLAGRYMGWIIPNPQNTGAAKRTETAKPLRLSGQVKGDRLFTGKWLHPERRSRQHGAFNFVVRDDNKHMDGMWLGYSERNNQIDAGRWVGERL